jgi:hypothetical protein
VEPLAVSFTKHIACEVLEMFQSGTGETLVRIDVSKPWNLETEAGQTQFVVSKAEVSNNGPTDW